MIHRNRIAAPLLLLSLSLPLLAACNAGDRPADSGEPKADGILARQVDTALLEARKQLATENIDLNEFRIVNRSVTIQAPDGVPRAEITPDGELIVEGRRIEVADPAARATLRDYRREVEALAAAGIDVGRHGAKIGLTAAGAALRGVFTGDTDGIEKQVEAEAVHIERAALALCDLLPGVLRAQQAAAAAVPEFQPYARMDASDVDDCRSGANDHHADAGSQATRDEIRNGIRDGIRNGIRGAAQANAHDATGRGATAAEAAADDGAGNAADEADAAATRE